MDLRYWPTRARQESLPALWPWVDPTQATDAARIQVALDAACQARLDAVPEHLLGRRLRERIQSVRGSLTATSTLGLGFDRVVAATDGVAAAAWSFEAGGLAWMLQLKRVQSLRLLPDGDLHPIVDAILQRWALTADGAQQAHAALASYRASPQGRRPTLALVHVPLLLWGQRDPEAAMAALDEALDRASPLLVQHLGVTVPLTYALCHALAGRLDAALRLLHEGSGTRAALWPGVHTSEARYHRARYEWDAGDREMAMRTLARVIAETPSQALRAWSDPAWREPGEVTPPPAIQHLLATAVLDARAASTRFVQTRVAGDDQSAAVREVAEIIRIAHDDNYGLLCTVPPLQQVAHWRAEQRTVSATLAADLARLTAAADAVPSDFPVRLGPGFAPRFADGVDSDMTRLAHWLDQGHYVHAEQAVARYLEIVPKALRVALWEYRTRLMLALATAGDILGARGREEDRQRYETIVALLQRCSTLATPIKDLPDELGAGLMGHVQTIWEQIAEVEAAWVRSEQRAYGQLRLVATPDATPIPRGTFRAFTVRVEDAAGQPVPGVPVLWRVTHGPGTPRQPVECLDGEWALSLQTGIVYLAIDAPSLAVGAGAIAARILGQHSPLTLPYQIAE